MADFTPVGTQIKPPQGMSLGEMVNMANAAQQYQQAQQMNPVQLERAQTELGRLKTLLPLEVSRATSEAGRSGIEYNVAGETAGPRISQAQSAADTAATEALKAKYGLDTQQHGDFAKILGGFAYDKRLSPDSLKNNPTAAVDVMHDIIQEARASGIPEKSLSLITAPGMTIASSNRTAFPDYLQNMIRKGMSPAEQRTAGLEKVETTPSGQVIRTTPATYGNQPKVSFETPGGIAPAPSTIEISGIKYFVKPPQTAGGAPVLTPVPAPTSSAAPAVTAPQPSSKAAQSMPEQPTSKLVNEDMPVPKGGIPQMNTQQQVRYDAGQKMFADAASGNQTAADQGVILNSIKQTLAQAQSSKPGQLLRQGGKFLAGNEQLDTLLKDLAQNQLLQAKMMGGVDSVNAQNTVAVANGSADIDPKALAKIIERTDATRLAAQMYNQGLSSYKTKDPYNSAIHADNFQQAWKSNYDPRIFMVENINASDRTPKQKQDDIKRIIGMATPAELQQLKQKAINIRRLQTGDF
jgi:hypothetical protein